MSRVNWKSPDLWASVISIVAAAILAVFLVFAIIRGSYWGRTAADGPTDQRFGLQGTPIASRVIMDRVSGVYYLVLEDAGGIAVTPLLNLDGLPLCVDDMNHGDIEMGLRDVRSNMQRWEGAE